MVKFIGWGVTAVVLQMYERYKRDYYKILGISRKATQFVIRQAYIKYARKYHPDRNKSPNADSLFKIIEEAKSILSYPEKRKKYDWYLSNKNKNANSEYTMVKKKKKTDIKYPNQDINESINSLDPQYQDHKLLYLNLLNSVESHILNRQWEKAEDDLNLASKFAKIFNLDHTLANAKRKELQYYSEKVQYKGYFSIYRSDYEVLFELDKSNPLARSAPLFTVNKGSIVNLILLEKKTKSLPNFIGNLIRLQELHIINENHLPTLPNSICKLQDLKKLYLKGNQLIGLPKFIGNLKNLKYFYLEGNKLIKLPESIGNLENLEWFYLEGDLLKYLPESIGNLENLEGLHFSGIQLRKLPDSIGNLKKIKILDIEGTKISKLPNSISNLKSLKILNLVKNQLSSLPNSIGDLQNLEILNLKGNNFSELPESIGDITTLKTLNLVGNPLKKLPESLGNLEYLEQIYLEDKHIKLLPKSIKNLKNLDIICITEEKKITIPRSLKKFKRTIKIKNISRRNERKNRFGRDIIRKYFKKELSLRLKTIESDNLFLWLEKQAHLHIQEKESFRRSLIQTIQASRVSYQPSREINYQYITLY